MALNDFTDNEAIEICISLRDKLSMDYDLPLKERWAEKDALAHVINLAVHNVKEKCNE